MKLEVVPLWMVREGEEEGPAHLVTTSGFACGEDTGETTFAYSPRSHDHWENERCAACAELFDELPIGPIIVDTETL